MFKTQEQRRAEFVANLNEIERKARNTVSSLPNLSDQLANGVEAAFETMRSAVVDRLLKQVNVLKGEAESGLNGLIQTFAENRSMTEQLQKKVSEEVIKLNDESQEMIKTLVVVVSVGRFRTKENCQGYFTQV